jgi:acyl-CoA synthetase (AMP-forming)/AMP-acid ligase II/acyl-coenzyme A thioesterase PaaI-like protein
MQFQIADLIESIADAIPEKPALVSGERRFTFGQLDERATRLANHWRKAGVKPGQHIGLYLYNGNEYLECLLAAFKLRVVPVNVNYRYVENELAYLCKNADLVLLVHQPELRERAAAVGVPLLEAGAEYEAALASASPARDFPQRSGDDIYMVYTGGTTGLPRGVMWRHEDVFFAGLQGGNPGGDPISRPEELAPLAASGDKAMTFFPTAPFIHGAAQWAGLIGLFGGGKVVISPGPRFDARRAVQLIAAEQVNTMTLVGDAMARPLADAIEETQLDTSSLFVISSAGAILSRSVREQLTRLLPNVMIINSYGASEAGHAGNALPDDEGARPRFMMDASCCVLDSQNRPLAPGSTEVGRLARTGRIPLGYYNDPEKTAATFLNLDGKRWVVPGDLATIDSDGLITIHGRGAVCINSGGEKIFPEEVEEALKAHPAVEDAVVVGIPDARWGERVAALIRTRAGQTPVDLDAHCRKLIAGYKVPRDIHLVADLERHPSGKPDYRWAKSEATRRSHVPENLPASWRLAELSPDGVWGALRQVAASIRSLGSTAIRVDPTRPESAADLAAIAADLAAIEKRLQALPAKSWRDAFVDGTYAAYRSEFMDRGGMVGWSSPISPPIRLRNDGETAIGEFILGPTFEGAPGFAHGGFLAAAFDQVFGWLAVLRGEPSLTASLTVHYRLPTPIETPLVIEARLERQQGRKAFVRAALRAGDQITAEAEGLFIRIDPEQFNTLLEARH